MKALYLTQHFKDANSINITTQEKENPVFSNNQCLIKVKSSGINPSDALGTLGYFPHASLPRIPGRDFAGTIVEGRADLIGKHVWGSGGGAGINFDGTHAEYLVLADDAIAEIPNNLDLTLAGAQPLPYITAYFSLVTRAKIKKGESIGVIGALGQVGSAAMSICKWLECNPIAIVRGNEELQNAKMLGWDAIDSTTENLAEQLIAINNGKKIDVVLNSVGNILWSACMHALEKFGRIVTIGARDGMREVSLNLFELYRSNQEIIGVDTVALNYAANAKLLNEMRPGFEAGILQPLKTSDKTIFTLEQASLAYQMAMTGSDGNRILLMIS